MNDKDKEAFLKWYSKETASVLWEDSNGDEIVLKAWQAACEYKQKEIDDLEESLAVRLAKSYIAGKDLSKIIQKNLANEVEKLQTELDRINNYTILGYQQGIEELQNIIEKLQAENKDMISKLKCLKSDYWFMTTLIERYSSDKEQALNDCLERMKFRKPLFNFLEEE